MNIRVDRIPAARKHGAYSATAVLPGESHAGRKEAPGGFLNFVKKYGLLFPKFVQEIASRVASAWASPKSFSVLVLLNPWVDFLLHNLMQPKQAYPHAAYFS
jgi:hypothetical protein